MKMYRLSCPQCGWKAQMLVTEDVARKFTAESCRDCKQRKRPASNYKVETVTMVRGIDLNATILRRKKDNHK